VSPQPDQYFPISGLGEDGAVNVNRDHRTESFLAICAVFKNEAPYLDEWVRFHKAQGVEHFYLYNNFSDDNFEEVLKPHQAYITITPWPVLFAEWGQLRAYVDCIERHRKEHRWITVIDIDEFIFGVNQPLADELLAYEHSDQMLVNCICYGTSGLTQVPTGAITKYLNRRAPMWWRRNAQRKSVFNPMFVRAVETEHEMTMREYAHYLNGDGRPVIPWKKRPRGRVQRRIISLHQKLSLWLFEHMLLLLPNISMLLLDPYGADNRFNDGVSRIRINHYVIRSPREFPDKVSRFKGTQFEKKYDKRYLKFHDQNQVYDPILSDWESGGMYG
jgi:hypothetical protein